MDIIKTANIDFIGRRKFMYMFSLLILVIGMTVFGIRGKENFGVDFTGGDMLNLEFTEKASAAEIRETVGNLNIGHYSVQVLGSEEREFIIKSNPGTQDTVINSLAIKYGKDAFLVRGQSRVAPSMSVTLRKRAFYAFLAGIIGILLYLTVRFEFRFAVGATLAIFHDMLFVLAFLAFTRKQIDAPVVAALLTVAGYSVNDTVVIFDRIRENLRKHRGDDYTTIFNKSINETLSRTLLTLLTTLFVIFCLFFLGGEALRNFSFALLIGFTVGTYSSIFIATSVLIDWHRLQPHKFNV